MKKITLICLVLFSVATLSAQTYSTGTVVLSSTANLEMSVKIDVSGEVVTMQLIGPADRYLGMGFGVNSMETGGDNVIYLDSPSPLLTDRTFDGTGAVPSLDVTQNWNILSNDVVGNQRTIIATRARVSNGNYTFPTSASALPLVWARANAATYSLGYHGGGNRGVLMANITLTNTAFSSETFKMYPNPAENFINFTLPKNIDRATVKVYNSAGQILLNSEISSSQTNINTAILPSGIYMVVIRTEAGNVIKSLAIK